jgi:NADH-quinone oxidoreductase subunit C
MSDDKKPESREKKETAAPAEDKAENAEAIQSADPKEQTTSEPSDAPAAELKGPSDEEKEAKAKKAAEARAARAKAKAEAQEEEEAPKEPSSNQPRLDRIVEIIKQEASESAIEEAYINEIDSHMPYIIIKPEYWVQVASLLAAHPELKLNYLRNLSGVDQESHMEVVYHLISIDSKHEYVFKVKTDREEPSVPSVTPIWATANWNEREAYDLLGIDFPGHPDLRRIMMSDDWVGHPLRKDYESIDPEV